LEHGFQLQQLIRARSSRR